MVNLCVRKHLCNIYKRMQSFVSQSFLSQVFRTRLCAFQLLATQQTLFSVINIKRGKKNKEAGN